MFTPHEKKAIIFLCSILLLGGILRLTKYNQNSEYQYQTEEKLLVNVNLATTQELVKLSGIGEKTAKKIIDFRNEFGDFSSLDDLEKVHGLGPKKIDNIKNFIVF